MTTTLLIIALPLLVAVIVLQVAAFFRKVSVDLAPIQQANEKANDRTERAVRDEIAKNRAEGLAAAKQSREELGNALKGVGDSLNKQLMALMQANDQKLDKMRETIEQRLGVLQEENAKKLAEMRQEAAGGSQKTREEVTTALKTFNESVGKTINDFLDWQRRPIRRRDRAAEGADRIERETAGEGSHHGRGKAQGHPGGQRQELGADAADGGREAPGDSGKATGRILQAGQRAAGAGLQGPGRDANPGHRRGRPEAGADQRKTRGTWGEVQLGAMLEQVLMPEQYDTNVATKDDGERVEFAIKLPGRGEDKDEIVWLPIDAKFPIEDYQRLVEAQEQGDAEAAEAAGKHLENRIKACAEDICEKYLNPPKTTDFGILFLPTEGLFAEVMRRTGLSEMMQRECRVSIAGPTTLWSILNSLQMGFRTLAIQKRSSEVWNLLAAVKTEFGKYGEVLDKVQKKLQEASNTIDETAVRSRAIERKLRGVQELPAADAQTVLMLEGDNGDGEPERDSEANSQ